MTTTQAGVFNHVAVTVPHETLLEPTRSRLVEFYREVFGWEPSPYMADEKHLVLRVYRRGQYLNLTASEQTTQMRPGDHVGLQVDSFQRLGAIASAARRWKERRDAGAEVSKLGVTPSEEGPVYSLFIRYMLPLRIEVQYYATPHEPRYALE